jgi:hypothetical protein
VDTDGHQKAEQASEDGSDGFSREEDWPSASAKGGSKVRTGSPLRRRKRESEDDAERAEEERRELAAQLQAEYGEIRWSGPVRLGRREGILLTFDCGLAVIYTQEDRQQTGFLAAEEIAWLNPRVRARSVEIVLNRPADIAPSGSVLIHGRDDQLFEVLATIPRPAPPRSIERPQPTVVRRPTNPLQPAGPASSDGLRNSGELAAPDQGRSVGAPRPVDRGRPAGRPGSSDSRRPVDPPGPSAGTRRREPVTRRDRVGVEREREGEGRIAARLATAFSPTAYVELPDGVLRPCAWGGTGEPPAANASVHLREGASGWVAMSMFDGASAS